MATKPKLSKERIVEAAIDILDADGEAALTFRALALRLSTGSGAIYWHIDNKRDLLTAATEDVITHAVTVTVGEEDPREAIRAMASGLFDAIDAHPWAGTQLAGEPWQPAVTQIIDGIGRQLRALKVPQDAQFDAVSAVLNYIIGLAAQHAAVAKLLTRETDRSTFLGSIADRWTQLDPAKFPFLHQVSPQLREHDDREQFLAGIDIFLAGVVTAD
ncbi:TetR family transcriptional regulator [Rhodococcus sp. 1163]|uniref:TetR/AcrR family transcriptional regulator n=1 Tax=unclassified Rhodococcus (in: high G+C Gram-positive bacteria) TaxID=192944 RepID=UPI000A0420F8|nr:MULTISPECIES: TetR/AcrR family transcriptional regulator C-terminal domain-containing protein [unclassified Rhodococcus (in: high G+C Gram-positive bacteria)]ORI18807.1 TetR family transcriptional regulator [Rhodococcus sp. 1163]QCB49203.1 TetR family transcriptional regulator [Rhodococcus sp. PAMC28705]QCB59109.1 TetR family transcriptional regulator [Rhodococcus sp. PAMC28707]